MPNSFRFIAAIMLSAITGSVPAKNMSPRLEHFTVPVSVSDNATIEVEIYLPTEVAPRALVIVAPSSGGVSDPYLLQELAEPTYQPDKRGGLTKALLNAGYAVAFYNQRGYESVRSCITGNNFQARTASFVRACVVPGVRARVSLSTITNDTQTIFNALDKYPGTEGIPKLALAFSFGMYHVSELAGKGLIRPAGIVAVGGPRSSMASVAEYQMRCDHEFRIAEKAFSACPDTALSVDKIFTCSGIAPSPDGAEKMRAVLDSNVASREVVAARKAILAKQYSSAVAHYTSSDASEAMGGVFGGIPVNAAFSAHYYKEIFESRDSVIDLLRGYRGRTKFLFGEFDHLFPELEEPALTTGEGYKATMADTSLIPAVGHGLEDKSGFPPPGALAAIVHALDAVLAKSPPTK